MQKNDTVESMNVEIARFEGRKFYGKYSIDDYGPHHGLTYPEMKYHTSWDWLMPVVEKIEGLYEGYAFTVEIKGDWCLVTQNTQHWMAYGNTIDLKGIQVRATSKVTAVYTAVYQFITWYHNQQKQNNGNENI